VLGAVLLLWFLGYYVLMSRRREATLGQRLQGIWVISPGHKNPPLARMVVRTAVWWAPVCLAMVVQPDWPIVLRSNASGVEEDWGLTNLPWLLSLLWLMILGLTVLLNAKGRGLADRLSRTQIVERPRPDPAFGRVRPARQPWGARLRAALLRPRIVLNVLVLAAWIAAVIVTGMGVSGGYRNPGARGRSSSGTRCSSRSSPVTRAGTA